MNVSVDGEITTFERMTFEIVPGAVNFSVPKGARETNGK
jgi:diacylglycerol kinase family enzyme